MALLIPEIDLSRRVIYFGVRHHSPACAWHVDRLIREIRPDAVLIEGPRDADPLIPLLTDPRMRTPVAIYTTCVRKKGRSTPDRHAAYYPICDYSPELAAVRAGTEVGARVRFIDLSFTEQISAMSEESDGKAMNLLQERYLKHSRFIQSLCEKTGARDPDDLWDHLYEVDYKQVETAAFMRNVLAYCTLARQDYTPEMLAAEQSDIRESAMACAIAEETGRVIVVTGGFHTVALPDTPPKSPPKVQTPDDAQVVLVRYGFEQLDRLNGYSSGMPSPEFYQRVWEGREIGRIIVELGSELRSHGGEVSTDDEIAALAHSSRLADMRGHPTPSREDLLDGIRSSFIKGSEEIEGVFVLTHARNLLAGNRVGEVPPDAGQPPIVSDFRLTADRLRIDILTPREVVLDLYRRVPHRETSRFFHRLRFLDIPFAVWSRGPDFVTGENLDRIQEVWEYRWSPASETALIERSLYGSTIEEASSGLLLERFDDAESEGQGRRADIGTALVLEACRMGLHKHTQDLLARTGRMVAEDASFLSLARSITNLLMLHMSREPLEAHHLTGLGELAEQAFNRACYLLPGLAATAPEDEYDLLDALNSFTQVPTQLGGLPEHRELLIARLHELIAVTDGNPTIRGGASGILYGDGELASDDLVAILRGHLLSAKDSGAEGVSFLRGLLRTARSSLWQVPEIIDTITEVLTGWPEDDFIHRLPDLRLAFADLTPRECDRVGQNVADRLGVSHLQPTTSDEFSTADLLAAVDLNRRVRESLGASGLKWGDEVTRESK